MMSRALAIAVALVLIASPTLAATRFIVESIYNPSSPTDPTTLRGGAGNGHTNVTVTCYYPTAITQNCVGGGDFDTKTSCTDTDNKVTVIRDNSTPNNCFYRKDFGLNGIADARQCGVIGDGLANTDVANLNNCMTVAAANNIYRTYTGGGAILDNPGMSPANIAPPQGMTLTCGGNNTGSLDDDDYRKNKGLTNAIVLDLRDTIDLSQPNTAIEGCNILAGPTGGLPGGTAANPYSPWLWYPKCDPTMTACMAGGGPSLRSATNEYSAFDPNETALYNVANSTCAVPGPPIRQCGPASGSVGITIKAENVAVRNVTVLGFGTCYYSTQVMGVGAGKRPVIDHLNGDCDTGIVIDQSPDATQFNGFDVIPFLTGHNGGASTSTTLINDIADNGSGAYEATVQVDTSDFVFAAGDVLWVNTNTQSGRESASGRWTVAGDVTSPSPCGSADCQTFTLVGSTSSAISATGNVSNAVVNGVPPTAVTGVVGTNKNFISVGQAVTTGTSGCIPPSTTVTDVWQAQSIVYLSAPVTCTHTALSLTFTDISSSGMNDFQAGSDCGASPSHGCAIVDANIRFGDGMRVTHSGGLSIVNCQVFDHTIAYHMYTGANAVRIANCSTGDNVSLPDNSFVGLQIDGDHSSDNGDSCGVDWANGVLGQFRPVSVLVNSDCTTPNKLVNVGIASSNARRNGSSLELDAGAVLLANAKAGPSSNMLVADYPYMIAIAGSGYLIGDTLTGTVNTTVGTCSGVTISVPAVDSAGGVAGYSIVAAGSCTSDAEISSITWTGGHGSGFTSFNDLATLGEIDANRLNISNNALPKTTLYIENATAASNTVGCGNVFVLPTPYLCAPPLAGLTPGGRLTLCSSPPPNCTAVMTQGVTGASTIYYVPYVSQQVPLYNTSVPVSVAQPSSFTLSDIGSMGLTFSLDMTSHPTSNLYDLFVENVRTGAPELCSGAAWTSPSTPSVDRVQIQGVWVNATSISTCKSGSGATLTCPAYACTYLGTFYTTATGQTSQQIGSISATGGGANCLCLYNAYNRVTLMAASLDSSASYNYATNVWRPMNAATPPYKNRITIVDGLAQTTISALLSDALNKSTGGGPAAMGVAFDTITGTPPVIAQNAATALSTLQTAATDPPQKGLRYVQAMEDAAGAASATFGGNGYQQLIVQIED